MSLIFDARRQEQRFDLRDLRMRGSGPIAI